MKALLLTALLLGAIAIQPAHADIIAYSDPAGQGTQAFGGNLALGFTVNSSITITALGAFNALGTGVIHGPIQVVIYNTTTNTRVTPVVTFAGSYATAGFGYDVFQTITPVVLGPGNYEVDAVGFSGNDLNGNRTEGAGLPGPTLNSGSGALTFTTATYDSSTTLDDPSTCSGCVVLPASTEFDAGTFEYVSGASVPEPSSLVLLVSVALLAGAALRKRG